MADTPGNEQNTEESTAGALAGAPLVVPKDGATSLTKSQQKKRLREAKREELKRLKKERNKQLRISRAKEQGRDLEAEQRLLEERTRSGHGVRRKQALWKEKLEKAQNVYQICLDCSFEKDMLPREIASLASQIRYCYSTNKRADIPSLVAVTGLEGETLQLLEKETGFETWGERGFTCTAQSMEEYYSDRLDRVVYLTSDSTNTLEQLRNDKIYVIGGIVDRNRLKKATLGRAESMGVATARLPLDDHFSRMHDTRVLACNHVFDILAKYRLHDSDWSKALADALSHRKEVTANDGINM